MKDYLEDKMYEGTIPAERIRKTKNKLVIRYARAILLAMDIREGSYNREAAELEEESQRRKALGSQYPYMYVVEYSKFYEKDMMQSISEALTKCDLPDELAYPIYLSFEWWNDIQDWAKEKLGI